CVRVAIRHRLSDRVHALDAANSVSLRSVVTRVAYAHGADSEKPSIHADNVDAVCRAASLERHAPSVITAANLVFHVADVAKRESYTLEVPMADPSATPAMGGNRKRASPVVSR